MSFHSPAERISKESFASMIGVELVEHDDDRVVVKLPYQRKLGVGRIHGGAISALVDIAATAAFWSCPDLTPTSQGATVGFTINFLKLAVGTDLVATATVRRRGGTLCTGDVSVRNEAGEEVAAAMVTYKLTGYRPGTSNSSGEAVKPRRRRLREVLADIRAASGGFKAADNIPRDELYDRNQASADRRPSGRDADT